MTKLLNNFSSVAQSCSTLCDTMGWSMAGIPVHHQLPELNQTHLHWVGDAIQPSQPLSPPSPPALKNLLQWVGESFTEESFTVSLWIRWPKYWCFNFSLSPSNDHSVCFFLDWLIWSPCCPRDSLESSPAPRFESINSSVLSLLYGPAVSSVYDYWRKHSSD